MSRYKKPPLFEALTGYTVKAQERKREGGVWLEGYEYIRAPDGNILMDMEGYERWVEGRRQVASSPRATGLPSWAMRTG